MRLMRTNKRKFQILNGISGALKPVKLVRLHDARHKPACALSSRHASPRWRPSLQQLHQRGSRLPARQGRLTLLLGPPGSGKSTLLKALAGKLRGKSPRVQGRITYNGETLDQFVPQRTAAYVSQVRCGVELLGSCLEAAIMPAAVHDMPCRFALSVLA